MFLPPHHLGIAAGGTADQQHDIRPGGTQRPYRVAGQRAGRHVCWWTDQDLDAFAAVLADIERYLRWPQSREA